MLVDPPHSRVADWKLYRCELCEPPRTPPDLDTCIDHLLLTYVLPSDNGAEDPDCWYVAPPEVPKGEQRLILPADPRRWTWKQCHTPKLAGLPPDIYNLPEPNTWG